jgi:hypothetical protein
MGKLEESAGRVDPFQGLPTRSVHESWQDRGLAMDGLRELLDDLKQRGLADDNFAGLLNVVIGRRVARTDGTVLTNGVTWRVLAEELKRVRWDKDAVAQLSVDPAGLVPRDRERYWYQAIARARVDSPEARQAGDRLAEVLREAGYDVGPAPG